MIDRNTLDKITEVLWCKGLLNMTGVSIHHPNNWANAKIDIQENVAEVIERFVNDQRK